MANVTSRPNAIDAYLARWYSYTMRPNRNSPTSRAAAIILAVAVALPLASCGNKRLVEVFDNGPVGGPQGASEGYIWVGKNDNPPPGKSWAPTDPEKLTPEQKKRIRN